MKKIKRRKHTTIVQKKRYWLNYSEPYFDGTIDLAKENCIIGLLKGINIFFNRFFWKDLGKMSEEKGNLKGLAISFILISLIMGIGVGIVYFVGQSIY